MNDWIETLTERLLNSGTALVLMGAIESPCRYAGGNPGSRSWRTARRDTEAHMTTPLCVWPATTHAFAMAPGKNGATVATCRRSSRRVECR